MSPICGLINTPNLNICLSSSKLKFSHSKRLSRTVLHKTQSWMHTTRLNLLMQRSNVHSKKLWLTNINEYHAQNTCFKCKFKVNYSVQIPSHKEWFHIHTMVSQFKALESDTTLTLTKKNIMHNFTHRFSRIFQSTFVSAHSRSKRSFQVL